MLPPFPRPGRPAGARGRNGGRGSGQAGTATARRLYDRLRSYQDEVEWQRWGPVRIPRNMDLFFVEQALAIGLGLQRRPSEGYRLAANFCEEYDPSYGTGLLRKSRARIRAIARFVVRHEIA